MFQFLKKQYINVALGSTLNADLKELRNASLAVQQSVGRKVAAGVQTLSEVSEDSAGAKILQNYAAHYKHLRHAANDAGATSGRDPDYAYASIMEAIVISSLSGDLQLSQKICGDVVAWLQSIGLIRR